MTHLAVPDLIARAQGHGARIALFDSHGKYSYDDLLNASARIAATLLNGRDDLREERIAFLITPGFLWVAVQWGIWRAGGIAVPARDTPAIRDALQRLRRTGDSAAPERPETDVPLERYSSRHSALTVARIFDGLSPCRGD